MAEGLEIPKPNYINPTLGGSPTGSLVTSITLGTVALLAVTARLWARFGILRRTGLDDLAIVIALGIGIGYNIVHELGIHQYGYARHMWDVPPEMGMSYSKTGLIATELFLLCTAFIKISVLLFYRRILRGGHGRLLKYNRINHALMVLVVACLVGFGIAVLYTCIPIEAFWKQYDRAYVRTANYSCYQDLPAYLGATYVSLTFDVIIFVFPLVFLRHVQTRAHDKWALRTLFFMCFTACVAGLIRTIFMTLLIHSPYLYMHSTYSFHILLWGTIEIYTAIVCVCAPALKPFFRKYFSSTFSNASNSKPSWFSRPHFSREAEYHKSPTKSCTMRKTDDDTESYTDTELLKRGTVIGAWADESTVVHQGVTAKLSSERENEQTHMGGVMKQIDVEVKYVPRTLQNDSPLSGISV